MSSKFVDVSAIIQVIGNVFKNPYLLESEDKYFFSEDDFTDEFHKIVFGSIYKINELGAREIALYTIEDYLNSRPNKLAIFKSRKGEEFLTKAAETASISTFDYYYNRMKKMTLMREFDNIGFDMTQFYDPDNILDIKKKQLQEDWLDNTPLATIAELVMDKIDQIKMTYVDNAFGGAEQAGVGARALKERLKLAPEVGVPLYGPLINTVTRGARLKKFYLRSAPTGTGKSRSMIADACNISCDQIYDERFGWIKNGTKEPVLFISTEQEMEEIQTMMWAFLSNVDEDHILYGKYEEGEEERVDKAIEIIENSPLYVELLPDFSLKDIENTIKRNVRDYGCKYVFMDYIHTSLKILEEISKRTKGMTLREDNVLFMISIRLKDLCNELGIFIMSATQLNADYQESKTPDQNLLRGAKSIADKIDMGSIILPVKEEDLISLDKIISGSIFEKPTIKISIYKNRRGKFKGVYLWCKANLGTCRIEPMFMTGWDYEILNIDDIKIFVKEDEPSAF